MVPGMYTKQLKGTSFYFSNKDHTLSGN